MADSRSERPVTASPWERNVERGRGSRLGLNAILNLSGSVSYYVAVVLVTPLAIHYLGAEAWGVWQLVGAATSYALLLNLGLNSAIAFHVSSAAATADLGRISRSIVNARLYLVGAAILIGLAFAVGGPLLVDSLVPGPAAETALLALAISVLLTALSLPLRIFTSLLSGLQRFGLLASFRLLSGAVLLAGAGIGFLMGMDLPGFAAVMTIAPALPGLLGWLASRRFLPTDCFRWRGADWEHLRGMLAYSVSTVLYVTGTVVLYQSLKFIASWKCGGPVAAGHIGLVINIVQTLSVAFVPLAAVLQPRVAALFSSGQQSALPELLRRSLATVGLVAVPIVVFLSVEAHTVFDAWVGRSLDAQVVELLARTARWMLLGQGLYVVFLPCFYALLGLGEHRVFGWGMLVAGVATVATSVAIAPFWPSIETLGGVFGAVLGGLVLFVTVPVTFRRFGLDWSRVLGAVLVVPLLASSPGWIALLFRPVVAEPLLDLALAGAIFGVLTAPCVWIGRSRLLASPGAASRA